MNEYYRTDGDFLPEFQCHVIILKVNYCCVILEVRNKTLGGIAVFRKIINSPMQNGVTPPPYARLPLWLKC